MNHDEDNDLADFTFKRSHAKPESPVSRAIIMAVGTLAFTAMGLAVAAASIMLAAWLFSVMFG